MKDDRIFNINCESFCKIILWVGYSFNEGKMLTLAMVDAEHAEPGAELNLVWGEENGGTSKPTVERHVQTELKAVVSPVPYAEVARKIYADGGWRAHQEEVVA